MKWLWRGVTVRPLQVFSHFWPGFVGRGGVGVGLQYVRPSVKGFPLKNMLSLGCVEWWRVRRPEASPNRSATEPS